MTYPVNTYVVHLGTGTILDMAECTIVETVLPYNEQYIIDRARGVV